MSNNGWKSGPQQTQIAPDAAAKLSADSDAAEQGQHVFFVAGSAEVTLDDGTTPGLLSAGQVLSQNVAAGDRTYLFEGTSYGVEASDEANDGFDAADVLAVAYDAGNGVPGKLAVFDGDARSVMGLVLGLDPNGRTPRLWTGRIAALLAALLAGARAKLLGGFQIADAAAGDEIAEVTIPSEPVACTVTAIEFSGDAVAANNTNYGILTVRKRGSADAYAAGTSIGTYDTRITGDGAIAAFVPAAFTLSAVAGALNLRADDILTIETEKGGTGQVLRGAVRVVGKAVA